MLTKRLLRLIAPIFALVALPVFAAAAEEPVRIGLIVPLTGGQASTGKQLANAVKLYMSENGDNVAGRKIEVIVKDDSAIPEDLRLAYKILKNSNCLPIEMELRKEIFSLRQLLASTLDEDKRLKLRRELSLRVLDLNLRRPRGAADLDLQQW